ncbi:MAG: hypothetical protein A2Z14_00840 [Chloroflexi bacterium RBG_16_48_8]|nr:MAG: hypothetical protein A2Z14_00840 [Chloroflexi bacterium RBG_16_48_8]
MVRVTREKLIDLACEEAKKRGQTEDVISGYLIGSVASGDPMINGSADIDLVLIHQYVPVRNREFVPLSENIHFDITHHHGELYGYPPDLRIHPWLGPSMCEPIFLYDPDHFFERAQAGVRGQFFQIDYVHARSKALLERACHLKAKLSSNSSWISAYARSIMESVNALTTLGGFPVAGRRMGLLLRDRLKELGFEEHFIAFQNLLGGDLLPEETIQDWLDAWEGAFDAAGYLNPAFNPARKNYFQLAFRNLIDSKNAETILWNLITTWDQALEILENAGETTRYDTIWEDVLLQLELSNEFRYRREAELEHHLDTIEEILENWA